jgi:chorismate synthase
MGRLRYLTAGESHGQALAGILDGMPAGLVLDRDEINRQLTRRQGGHGRGYRQQIEQDQVEVLSGVRHGVTMGSPIALVLWNRDWKNWQERMGVWEPPADRKPVTVPRPGHADLAGAIKYQHTDIRNVLERASARETATRVALAAIARQLLEHFDITIGSHVVRVLDGVSEVAGTEYDEMRALSDDADASPVRSLDKGAEETMIARIDQAQKERNTVGGVFEVIARGVPPGLGSHVQWDRKLDAQIAQAMMSMQAQKGVEIGTGFGVAESWGSEVHDEIYYDEQQGYYRQTGGSGGIEGGMSTGEPIAVRVAMKPLSTLMRPLDSVDIRTQEPTEAHIERSDVTAVPAASVVGEHVLALTLADAFLEKMGGDSVAEIEERYERYRRTI